MNALTDISENETIVTSVSTMQSDLVGIVLNICKGMPDVWQRMPEEAQQDFIDSVDKQVQAVVETCVKHIAADGRPYVLAKVDQVVFKGAIEAKLKIERDPEGISSGAHELADQTGERVMIILPGLEEYEGDEGDKPKASSDQPDLLDSESDDMYDDAVEHVRSTGKATISSVQRGLKIGYNRAARLIEMMERVGIVSTPNENGGREVIG